MCDFAGGWGEKDCTTLRELLPRRVKPLRWTDIRWREDGHLGTVPGVPMETLRIRPYLTKPKTYSVFRHMEGNGGHKTWHGLDALEALCLLNHLITEEGNSG